MMKPPPPTTRRTTWEEAASVARSANFRPTRLLYHESRERAQAHIYVITEGQRSAMPEPTEPKKPTPVLHLILDDGSGIVWNVPQPSRYRHAIIDLPDGANLNATFDVIVEYTRIVAKALTGGDKS